MRVSAPENALKHAEFLGIIAIAVGRPEPRGVGGWGTWIRTRAARVRAESSTAKLSPSKGAVFGPCRSSKRGGSGGRARDIVQGRGTFQAPQAVFFTPGPSGIASWVPPSLAVIMCH